MSGPTILPFSDAAIACAATSIKAGGIVAVPTETVYGLAADATNADAVARIYAAKGRPSFNPLIVHLPISQRRSASRCSMPRRARWRRRSGPVR
jgi:tRNA A37 threonylcarbamoyladenosine synthetase subunit TsaC/SUA5/YrdC